jgi:hypothetical protein
MSCASGIEPRENTRILDDAFGIRSLETAQESLIDIRSVCCVAIAGCNDSGVDASGVTVPNVRSEVFDGIASFSVNELKVPNDVDASLILADI